MSRKLSSRAVAVLLAFVPGWGHIYLGREGQGLGIFTLGAMSAFTLFNALVVYLGELRGTLIGVAAIATSGVLLFSIVDVLRLTAPLRLARLKSVRDRLLWDGMISFLRSDYLAAEQKFIEGARLDPLDPEPVFRAGVVASRRGELREARRLLARAAKLDLRMKWEWELREEIAAVDERLRIRQRAPEPPPAVTVDASEPASKEPAIKG